MLKDNFSAQEIKPEFERGFGYGFPPDTLVSTMIDPNVFKKKFGPPYQGSSATFGWKTGGEWVFHTADTLRQTVKVAIMNGVVLIAVNSDEMVAKFLAFVDQRK